MFKKYIPLSFCGKISGRFNGLLRYKSGFPFIAFTAGFSVQRMRGILRIASDGNP
ncbi:hypothetical protein [uncultured Fibrobacter sp.]|uniref:hypothetical protein n=1 Tax=uncultured Fibrobacter sp. TaxID=261512 RepID=UPI002596E33F|nr:hypothetical protein [uncultured Fibrobacter sp.]